MADGVRQRRGGQWLTFDEEFGPGVGDAVHVARLAQVLGLVVDRDAVDDESTRVLDVFQTDVRARRQPLSVLHTDNPHTVHANLHATSLLLSLRTPVSYTHLTLPTILRV